MELSSVIGHIEESLKFGELEVSKLTHEVISIEGLTSNKVKMFLNNLCSLDNSTYLELGVYRGATFCSAMFQNDCKGIAIDNWTAPLQPNTSLNAVVQEKSIQDSFLSNVKQFCNISNVDVYKAVFQDFNFSVISSPNIIYYDGEVSQIEIISSLTKLFESLHGSFILVVDDWNWTHKHVKAYLSLTQTKIHYKREIFTSVEDPSDFWNGLGVFLLEK